MCIIWSFPPKMLYGPFKVWLMFAEDAKSLFVSHCNVCYSTCTLCRVILGVVPARNLVSLLLLNRELLLLLLLQIEYKSNWATRISFGLLSRRVGISLCLRKWETWIAARLQIRTAEILPRAVLVVNIHDPKFANFMFGKLCIQCYCLYHF